MKKIITTTLLALLVTYFATAQIITTVAGTGLRAYGADGIAATASALRLAQFLTADNAGNIFISDRSDRIRKVDLAGIINTVAGNTVPTYGGDGGPATLASINLPKGIIVDDAGNIFFNDASNYRVRTVNASGIINTIAGTGTSGVPAEGAVATAAMLANIMGIAIDGAGNVYISDNSSSRISKINPAGFITTVVGIGSGTFSGDGGPASASAINQPIDIVIDRENNLYIADHNNYRVRKVDGSGIITTVAGSGSTTFSGDGGAATAAGVVLPYGLAVDSCDNLYIADGANHRIRKVNKAGIINTVAGNGISGFSGDGGPATAAMLSAPLDVHVDPFGNLLIADQLNYRIRRISFTNIPPAFTGGHSLMLTACKDAVTDISTLLSAVDADEDQTITWSLLDAPANGMAVVSHSRATGAGTLTPAGLSYTPAVGYTGADSFKIRIRDCRGTADTTTIYVTVTPGPTAPAITGADSVCMGSTITLAAAAGGAWSSSNSRATITTTGIVTGTTAGLDTIRYTVTNACGADTATHIITVKNCITSVNATASAVKAITIYPNPAHNGTFVLSIATSIAEPATIALYNILGIKVWETTATTNTPLTLQPGLPAGLYFIIATTPHGRWSEKILLDNVK